MLLNVNLKPTSVSWQLY